MNFLFKFLYRYYKSKMGILSIDDDCVMRVENNKVVFYVKYRDNCKVSGHF